LKKIRLKYVAIKLQMELNFCRTGFLLQLKMKSCVIFCRKVF